MPANSLIVGVDLAPIKPIPRAITFQSDITTDKCRATIRQHLKTWKADTVLHDGAPNVGIAWVQDAFSQAELALQALKLATEFLIEGGTFVTKVFRSKDYNALLWVCNQLFAKVEATKPPSSRNVSAEIFVVCRGFKAPKRIDPRLLDPRAVFAELSDPAPNNEAKVFNPEKKKRKRQGYEEGDHTQFKESPASEFIHTTDPIAMLGTLNRLSFSQPSNGDIALATLDKLPETTRETKDCCADLKVLGRKEFRLLLRWRLRARETFGFKTKKGGVEGSAGEEVTDITPMDEELKIQEEIQRIDEKESGRRKRDRRRENERKQREITRMQLHMLPPTEIGLEQAGPNGEDSMFALAAADRAGAIERIARGKMAIPVQIQEHSNQASSDEEEESDGEEDQLDRELDSLYSQYQERKSQADAKRRAKKARKERQDGDWEGFSDKEESDSEHLEEDSDSDSESMTANNMASHGSHLIIETETASGLSNNCLTQKAAMFFDQDIFKDLCGLAEDEEDSAIYMESDDAKRDAVKEFSATFSHVRGSSSVAARATGPETNLNHPRPTRLSDTTGSTEVRPEDEADSSEETHNQKAGFEVVQTRLYNEWERQDEPRRNGRLGNPNCPCYRALPEADRYVTIRYRHYHSRGDDISTASGVRREDHV